MFGRRGSRASLFAAASMLALVASAVAEGATRPTRQMQGVAETRSEDADSIPGVPLQAVDPRTGGPVRVAATRMLATGHLDTNWSPDSLAARAIPFRLPIRSASSAGYGTFAVWTDESGAGTRVRLRQLRDDSAPEQWISGGSVVCSHESSQQQPDVAAYGSGGAFVVWTDFRTADGDIYAQRIGPDGAIATDWPESGVPVCIAEGQQANPRVLSLQSGGAVVVWEDRRSGRLEAFWARLDDAGTTSPPNGSSLSGGGAAARNPQLHQLPAGGALATWQQRDSQPSSLLAATIGDGWPGSILELSVGAEGYGEVASVPTHGGSLTLGWTERGPGGSTVKLRRIAGGTIEGSWPAIGGIPWNGALAADAPSLVATTDSTIAIAWQAQADADESDVFVTMLDEAGNSLAGWPVGGVPACRAPGDQYMPGLVADGTGGALITWNDARTPIAGEALVLSAARASAVELKSTHVSPGRAKIVWRLLRGIEGPVLATRRIGDGGWESVASPSVGDSALLTLDDRTVPDGAHVEYRLALTVAGTRTNSEVVALDIPTAPRVLALHRVRALGRENALLVSFALPRGESPRVDLLDVQGRRMLDQRIGGLEPGEQQYRWQLPSRVASGVYFLRLIQGGEVRTRKVFYLQ